MEAHLTSEYPDSPTMDVIEPSLQSLVRRLEEGWQKIEARSAASQSVESWNDHWITLLEEYQSKYDALSQDGTS